MQYEADDSWQPFLLKQFIDTAINNESTLERCVYESCTAQALSRLFIEDAAIAGDATFKRLRFLDVQLLRLESDVFCAEERLEVRAHGRFPLLCATASQFTRLLHTSQGEYLRFSDNTGNWSEQNYHAVLPVFSLWTL